MSSTKRLAHQVSATPPSPRASYLDDAVRRSSFTLSSSDAVSSSSSSSTEASAAPARRRALPLPATTSPGAFAIDMPRTTEVLWNGTSSLGFTLKRKRKTGAILVSKVMPSCASRLRIGSELKLVSGFPVKQLTLDEVKKVMLRAPKPVSLVFLNQDDAAVAQQTRLLAEQSSGSFLSECSNDRGSFENEFSADVADAAAPLESVREHSELRTSVSARTAATFFDTAPARASLQRTVSDFTLTAPSRAPLSPSAMSTSSGFTTYTNYYAKPSDSHSKKRKVSKLRVALDRMSQLLNRPVRQSALNIPADRSIVV